MLVNEVEGSEDGKLSIDMSNDEMIMMAALGTRFALACAVAGESSDHIIRSLISKGVRAHQDIVDELDDDKDSATAE